MGEMSNDEYGIYNYLHAGFLWHDMPIWKSRRLVNLPAIQKKNAGNVLYFCHVPKINWKQLVENSVKK